MMPIFKKYVFLSLSHLLRCSVFLLLLLDPSFLWAQGYNEMYTPQGELRTLYKPLAPILEALNPKSTRQFLHESRLAFSHDNALDPIPRLLSEQEFEMLEKGVQQRARAIVAFLKDYYSGDRSFESHNIIPKGIVDQIAARNGDILFQGQFKPQEVNFFYGPDIIRDSEGTWRVIEDNPGFIGGLGDLKLAQEFMLQKFPQLPSLMEIKNADDFYEQISRVFIHEARRNGGRAVVYMQPPYADNEDYRIQELFSEYGILVITPKTTHKRLVINEKGVFLSYFQKGKPVQEKVGFLFLNGEHAWVDSAHPISQVRNLLETAQEALLDKTVHETHRKMIQKTLEDIDPNTQLPNLSQLAKLVDRHTQISWRNLGHLPGLVGAILKGQVATQYTPGIDFIGDKQFYMYVEDLIRFYLKQEPIIRNIPTESFVDFQGRYQKDKLEKVTTAMPQYVIKKVDGRGGDGVWVGPKVTVDELATLKSRIEANPSQYIHQKYLNLSELNGNIVDLRLITMVMDDKAYVAATPWGRGLPKSGNGKVNLSDQGREIAVFVVKDKDFSTTGIAKSSVIGMCRALFKNLGNRLTTSP